MTLFATTYADGDGYYGAYIDAEDATEARAIAMARRIGEHVDGEIEDPALPNRLAELINAGEWVRAAHEATFLAFVGISAGALTVRECLGDQGLVHELMHLALDPEDSRERRALVRKVRKMAAEFEYRVPGWQLSAGRPAVLGK